MTTHSTGASRGHRGVRRVATAVAVAAAVAVPLGMPAVASASEPATAVKASSGDIPGAQPIGSATWRTVQTGTCTDSFLDSDLTDRVLMLSCTHPHASEVYYTFTAASGPYPDKAASDQLVQVCDDHFPSDSALSDAALWPSEDEWAGGDRSIVCLAGDAKDAVLTTPLHAATSDLSGGSVAAPSPLAVSTALAVTGAVLAVYLWVLAVTLTMNFILNAIGLAALFRKTGVPVWKAWVPFVQLWALLRLGGQNGNWAWLSFVPGAAWVWFFYTVVAQHRIGKAFGKDAGFTVLGAFFPWLWAMILGFSAEQYRPESYLREGWPLPTEGIVPVPEYWMAQPYAPPYAQPFS